MKKQLKETRKVQMKMVKRKKNVRRLSSGMEEMTLKVFWIQAKRNASQRQRVGNPRKMSQQDQRHWQQRWGILGR